MAAIATAVSLGISVGDLVIEGFVRMLDLEKSKGDDHLAEKVEIVQVVSIYVEQSERT